MISPLIKRNVTVSRRRTSVRLEAELWRALEDICRLEGLSMHELCTLERLRSRFGLTSALRLLAVTYFRDAATPDGHRRAGHGAMRAHLTRLQANPPAGARRKPALAPALSLGPAGGS